MAAPSPESPGGDPQRAGLRAEEVGELRASVRARIEAANATTEREVLALGGSIHNIVKEARRYAVEVRQQIDVAGGETGIGEALRAQSETITGLSGLLEARLNTLQGRAAEAEVLCRDILEIGMRVNEIGAATKVLSLNARLEAARSVDGASFSVIAREMSALNGHVQESNSEINTIAQRLLLLLPEIRRQSGDLLKEATGFRDQLDTHGERVRAGEAALRAALSQCVFLGEERIAKIVAESREAAAHLAFQDPVAQSLMRIDADLHRLEARLDGTPVVAPLQVELSSTLCASAETIDEGDFVFL
jgi:hypothetical protein